MIGEAVKKGIFMLIKIVIIWTILVCIVLSLIIWGLIEIFPDIVAYFQK